MKIIALCYSNHVSRSLSLAFSLPFYILELLEIIDKIVLNVFCTIFFWHVCLAIGDNLWQCPA